MSSATDSTRPPPWAGCAQPYEPSPTSTCLPMSSLPALMTWSAGSPLTRVPMTAMMRRTRSVPRACTRSDRKITHGKWARGSGPGRVMAPGLVRGCIGLGGLGQGDVEAEGLDMADVVAELAVSVQAGLTGKSPTVNVPAAADAGG